MWFHKLPPKTERWQLRFSNMHCPQCPLWVRPMEAQCPPVPCLPLPPCFPCCFVVTMIVKTHSRLSSGFSGRLRERACSLGCSCRCTPGFHSRVGELGRWAEQCHLSPHTHACTHTRCQELGLPPTSELSMLLISAKCPVYSRHLPQGSDARPMLFARLSRLCLPHALLLYSSHLLI